MSACPYRKDFYNKLGSDQEKVNSELKTYLEALDKVVQILKTFPQATSRFFTIQYSFACGR